MVEAEALVATTELACSRLVLELSLDLPQRIAHLDLALFERGDAAHYETEVVSKTCRLSYDLCILVIDQIPNRLDSCGRQISVRLPASMR